MDSALDELGARVDGLFFCPHTPTARCRCRKPKPGLLEDLAQRLHMELTCVPFLGDTSKYVGAAMAVGAKPMLVLTGKGEETARAADIPRDVPVYENLAAAADTLLS